MRPAVVTIEFLRPWMNRYAVGQVVVWDHPGAADVLFRRGIAKLATAVPPPESKPKAKPKGK